MFVDIFSYLFKCAPDQHKCQKMVDEFVSEDPIILRYCTDRYKT